MRRRGRRAGRVRPVGPGGPVGGAPGQRPHSGRELTVPGAHGLLRSVIDTDVRLWRRVHMDLVRYAGCVCRPSC
ncbi:putative leader peptide [Streptomyces sp. NPDC048629]|uniref:putative leader peptide n=1 Tax=Streptomyces sp. NPDC048629 TaxID=3154824 RepID=UPI0034396D98